jgi:two-component system cell cycle sensor histidine kinase/response regulator CckA
MTIEATRPEGMGTVLFVDDEPTLRSLGRTILERYGYEVLMAEDGVEALEQFRLRRGTIDLVILDLLMPRLSGHETFRALQKIDRQVAVLFASGDLPDQLSLDEHDQIVGFVAKPYRPRELAAAVRTVLDRRSQVPEAIVQSAG